MIDDGGASLPVNFILHHVWCRDTLNEPFHPTVLSSVLGEEGGHYDYRAENPQHNRLTVVTDDINHKPQVG